MNFTELAGVSAGKIEALKERIGRLQINLGDVQESFTRGGGKGGQKINKTSNCVVLRYVPLALVVKNQRERKRSINRFLALRELVDQIEMRVSPQTSGRIGQFMKIRKQKD
ncbi:MAG: peptide chain release factor-like protein, partial [Elusimicrobia bacterium]|nr:peptide chain release factor-like protein [Elusimicrobiota bacterium]